MKCPHATVEMGDLSDIPKCIRAESSFPYLTHCGLVTPYDGLDLGQH